jgi:pilus assembly protein TadC
MPVLKDLFTILLLFSASVLCLMLVYYFLRIARSIEALERDFKKMSDQMTPLLESLNNLSRAMKTLADEVRGQLDKTNWIIDEVKAKVEGLLYIENRIKESMEHPAQSLMATLQTIKNGVSSLFKKRSKE